MAYLLERIKESLAKEGLSPRTNLARAWLKTKISKLRPTKADILSNRKRQKNKSIVGRMYFFYYDAKTKDSLPYYDRFPLVIPIEQYTTGFLGLNLHYISPKQRIFLLDKLSEFATDSRYDERTKLRLSYDMLKAATKIFQAKPCLKQYLYNHVESKFVEITADEWDIAALLPFESFSGASKARVFAESQEQF